MPTGHTSKACAAGSEWGWHLFGHVGAQGVQADSQENSDGDEDSGHAAQQRQPRQLLEGQNEHQRRRRDRAHQRRKMKWAQSQDVCGHTRQE